MRLLQLFSRMSTRSRRGFVAVAAAGVAALLCASIAIAGGYGSAIIHAGDLVISVRGGLSPQNLPRHKRVPITARVEGSLKTIDGTHVPPASEVEVEVDKDFVINTKGIPVCHAAQLRSRSSAAARAACGDSIVGSGWAEAEVAFPEQPAFRARGPLLFFNGGKEGNATVLLVHLYAAVPSPTAIVTAVKLTKIHNGRFGTKAVAAVPKIAGGSGSIVRFAFSLGRDTPGTGGHNGYIEASCPGKNYLTRAKVKFVDGSSYRASLALPCRGGSNGYGNGGYERPTR